MGNSCDSHHIFSKDELNDYQELTFFTKKEILNVYKKFSALDPSKFDENKNTRLPMDMVLQLPELQVNPFADRICKVFSSSNDGDLTFEDFLDMMSVFSDNAPKSVKVEYAFRIYDSDEDDFISSEDLKGVIGRLIGSEHDLTDDDLKELISNIFIEADLDDDDKLSFAEFEHVISKAPDFINSFRIRP